MPSALLIQEGYWQGPIQMAVCDPGMRRIGLNSLEIDAQKGVKRFITEIYKDCIRLVALGESPVKTLL
jgi:hypothetical protein